MECSTYITNHTIIRGDGGSDIGMMDDIWWWWNDGGLGMQSQNTIRVICWNRMMGWNKNVFCHVLLGYVHIMGSFTKTYSLLGCPLTHPNGGCEVMTLKWLDLGMVYCLRIDHIWEGRMVFIIQNHPKSPKIIHRSSIGSSWYSVHFSPRWAKFNATSYGYPAWRCFGNRFGNRLNKPQSYDIHQYSHDLPIICQWHSHIPTIFLWYSHHLPTIILMNSRPSDFPKPADPSPGLLVQRLHRRAHVVTQGRHQELVLLRAVRPLATLDKSWVFCRFSTGKMVGTP